MNTQMTEAELSQQAAILIVYEGFQFATAQHQAGELTEAERLYHSILRVDPAHPGANHNLGILAASRNQFADALPFFLAALDFDPSCGQYWLSYVDALFLSGQEDDARHVLALARAQGLEGASIEMLAARTGAAHASEVSSDQPVSTSAFADDSPQRKPAKVKKPAKK